MKVFKPDALALLYRNLRFGRRNLLSLGLMGMFHYGSSRRDALATEPELWAAVAAALGSDQMLDEGMPKTTAEFLVYGACHGPEGRAVEQLPVNIKVGTVAKTLYVFGDRQFTLLGTSAPKPFTRMPLGAANAFGGPGHPVNPLGKGFAEVPGPDGALVRPLPNVELPNSLIVHEGDAPAPAGFGALAVDSPQRQRLLGQFDDAWVKRSWPHLPEDTQPEFFQTAPPDQRMAGFFRGDEAISIGHMHLGQPLISTALPKLRARCFVNRLRGGREEFAEVEARAETVWLFPELECGIVLYRAVETTLDEEADDVLHMMAEWENLADAPLSFEHYQALFKSKLPAALAEAEAASAPPLAAAPAKPAVAAAAVALPAAAAVPEPPSPGMMELQTMEADLQAKTAEIMKRNGLTENDLNRLVPPATESPASVVELEGLIEQLEQRAADTLRSNGMTQVDVQKLLPPAMVETPANMAELQSLLQQVEAQTRQTLAKQGMTEASLREFVASRPELANVVSSVAPQPELSTLFAGLPAAPALAAAAAAPPTVPPPDFALPQAVAAPRPLTREGVVERHAQGRGFEKMDLRGLDLSGLDLAGANFTEAVLEKTSFANSKLAGSSFSRGLLAGVDFSGADLGKASLAGASAAAAKFAGTRMEGSDASAGDFSGADFAGAKLAGANLSRSVFDGAKMAGFSAADCRADGASFSECDLKGADFARANLAGASFGQACLEDAQLTGTRCEKTEFYGARAARANFAEANLKGSRADKGSQFADARFTGAHLGRANWEGAGIQKALFDKAVLDDADFSRVAGTGAQFAGASAKGAKFDKADLANADFTRVNLFQGSLRAAKLETTALKFSNLYGADFYGTTTTIANTEGSVIDNTLLPVRRTPA
ncbi:Uncharacterized protein YjbI, contains pentapeptide repeats [Polaromonas sp. YR568]|uniref:DUF2169 domain-containing protein n=1 Tax=Polaromonas sp. YR568 TaxID=1855301 RepID=UPI0008E251C5|nr:DUF2169 domain-containing protein [Polaromonas sp. YR568]SFU61460.1 Uncharacterized protein YjbI, contains pentapeptide repeats [Polaromonas sp. YR568]